VPPTDRGLLARLDALVALAADRHGLALLPDGRLAAAEARVAARATGLAGSTGARGRAVVERDAVELLRAVAEGSGCCGCAATGWRRPACATPGFRSTRACGPGWSMRPGQQVTLTGCRRWAASATQWHSAARRSSSRGGSGLLAEPHELGVELLSGEASRGWVRMSNLSNLLV
jgi:hypothetical protein